MQVNTTPIRQNKMTFKGEEEKPAESVPEKSLPEQLAEFKEKVRNGVTWEEASERYIRIMHDASRKLETEMGTLDDAKALIDTGIEETHLHLALAHDYAARYKTLVARAAVDQAWVTSDCIDTALQRPNICIKNPLPALITRRAKNLKAEFRYL